MNPLKLYEVALCLHVTVDIRAYVEKKLFEVVASQKRVGWEARGGEGGRAIMCAAFQPVGSFCSPRRENTKKAGLFYASVFLCK